MIEVATYQGNNPKWIGYSILDNEILWVRFEGNSQAEVIQKANAWYDREAVIGRHEIHSDEVSSKPYKSSWAAPSGSPASQGWGEPSNSMGDDPDKPHGLSGSVWLVHHGLRIKGRFPASKVDELLAQGYERGGPRTVFSELDKGVDKW